MRNLLYMTIVCFLLSGLKMFGQVDTTINGSKYNYVSRYDNGKFKELGNFTYKHNTKIKHGCWIIYDESGQLLEKGTYNNNSKTGIWVERGEDNMCCWTGAYKKGTKHGRWTNGCCWYTIYKHGKNKGTFPVK